MCVCVQSGLTHVCVCAILYQPQGRLAWSLNPRAVCLSGALSQRSRIRARRRGAMCVCVCVDIYIYVDIYENEYHVL